MISSETKFWSYLSFLIPSIICSLFVLYHLLFDRTLRQSLNNHIIILLLVIGLILEVTIYPWMLYYYQYQDSWIRSSMFCTIWAFLDWTLYVTQTILFAWASIERHILIFHDKWVSTKRKRMFIHYLPLITLGLYCLIFYIVIDYFLPCENFMFDFDMICVYFCSYYIYEVYMWETIVHQLLPVLIIVLFSIALFVRVLRQKYRLHQSIQWRKYRKMTIQILSISLLYLIFSFPFVLVTLMYLCGLLYNVYERFLPYANFFSNFIVLLFPFVCVLSLPELLTKLRNIFCRRRPRRTIRPVICVIRVAVRN